MNRNEQLLPLGSIVLLKEGMQKLVIIGRGAVYEDAGTGSDRFADYMGAIYPTGINPEKTIFFSMKILIKLCLSAIQMKKKSAFWRFMMNGNKV